jgi:hypothetical protein
LSLDNLPVFEKAIELIVPRVPVACDEVADEFVGLGRYRSRDLFRSR